MPYKEVDLKAWDRKAQYDFFKNYDNPYFNITADLEVSELYKYCKKNKYSFFLCSLYCSLKACNNIKPFRTRVIDEKICIFDIIHPASTVLLNNNTFIYCFMEFNNSFDSFHLKAINSIEEAKKKESFHSIERPDVIYHSVIPWISFTSFSNARKKGQGDDIPRIVFGKYYTKDNKLNLPVSVEVHHALMDGYHVGQYFTQLQKEFDEIQNGK